MKALLVFFFIFTSSLSFSQVGRQVVVNYMSLLNDCMATPNDTTKQERVLKCFSMSDVYIKDEFVDKYLNGKHCSSVDYLMSMFTKSSNSPISIEILSAKEEIEGLDTTVVVSLKYSGGISLTTVSDYWIKDGGIRGIVSNERLIAIHSGGMRVLNVHDTIIENHINNVSNDILVADSSVTFYLKNISFKMIFVEGGTFLMGRDNGADNESPAHQVTLDSYYIAEEECSNSLWESVMGYKMSKSKWATYMSREDVLLFIKRISQMTGKNFRLPTEAEWEFAARGGNKSRSYLYSGTNDYNEVVNTQKNTSTLLRNELGILYMTDYLSEMVSDTYYRYKQRWVVNPKKNVFWKRKYVLRGGGEPKSLIGTVYTRESICGECRGSHCGFRLALDTK